MLSMEALITGWVKPPWLFGCCTTQDDQRASVHGNGRLTLCVRIASGRLGSRLVRSDSMRPSWPGDGGVPDHGLSLVTEGRSKVRHA